MSAAVVSVSAVLLLVTVLALAAGALAGRWVLDERCARFLERYPRSALASVSGLPMLALMLLVALALRARAMTGAWPQPFSWQFVDGCLPVAVDARPSVQSMWGHVLLVQLAVLFALMSWGSAPVIYAALRRLGLRPSTLVLVGWAVSYVALIAFMYTDPLRVVKWALD